MKISVSSYSFSQALRSGALTLETLPAEARRLGAEAMDYTGLPDGTPAERRARAAEIRRSADDAGIPIVAYAVGADLNKPDAAAAQAEIDRLRGELEIAAILGAPILRHDICFKLTHKGTGRSFGAMLPVVAENARRITVAAAELGIRTCTENHGTICQDSDRIERLYDAVGHDNFGLLIDIGNFACVDEDSAVAVSRLAPYAIHVHVKDFYRHDGMEGTSGFLTRGGDRLLGAVPGDGIIPVRRCIRILHQAGYNGYYTHEYEGSADCIVSIERGIRYIRSCLDE